MDRLVADPHHLTGVVRFDRARLGDVSGLDVVHLQCHLGTDTLSLARLGARVTGVDLSGASLDGARSLAARAGSGPKQRGDGDRSAPEVTSSGEGLNRLRERATLVLSEYSGALVKRTCTAIVERCAASTWEESVLRLQRYFAWEYEDYNGT